MNPILDFLKNIRDRFTSAIFSSFTLSWLIVNWKVSIALLFYKQVDLIKDGYSSYIDLVKKESSICHFFWSPLFFALLYTFAFPFFNNLIRAFNSWIIKWGNDLNLKMSKGGKISIEKYLELRQELKKNIAELELIIDSESTFKKELDGLKIQNNILIADKSALSKELEIRRNANDTKLIAGEWINNYTQPNGQIGEETVQINGAQYLTQMRDRSHSNFAFIDNFYYDFLSNSVFFNKVISQAHIDKNPHDLRRILVNKLKISADQTEMYGTEYDPSSNLTFNISYRKRR